MHRTGKPITLITPESNCHRTWSWIVRGSTATLGHSAQSQVERFERENNQQNGRSRVLYWKQTGNALATASMATYGVLKILAAFRATSAAAHCRMQPTCT